MIETSTIDSSQDKLGDGVNPKMQKKKKKVKPYVSFFSSPIKKPNTTFKKSGSNPNPTKLPHNVKILAMPLAQYRMHTPSQWITNQKNRTKDKLIIS